MEEYSRVLPSVFSRDSVTALTCPAHCITLVVSIYFISHLASGMNVANMLSLLWKLQ